MPDSRAAIKTNKIPIVGLTAEQATSAPSSPVKGQLWMDTTNNLLKYYDGTAWIDTRARANHSGTQTASTISDFDTQVRTSTLNQMTAPTADLSINSHKLTSVSTPTASGDAATKGYVDTYQPSYSTDEGNARTINSTGSFLDFTGQPSITVTVPSSGKLLTSWGFSGYNSNSATASLRLSIDVSGANTSAANLSWTALVSGPSGAAGLVSVSRTRLYTGLSTGSTTLKLQARISSGSSSTCSINDAWLLVQPLP